MKIAMEHIGLPAADPVALKNWYERVLGARTIWDSGEKPPAYLVAFSGGGWLEIYAAKEKQPTPDNNSLQGFRHLALRVDSIEAAKAEAIQRGVVFTKEPGPAAGEGRVQYFADLEGNLLHFVERAADSQLGK
jgi:catechol 2,3-dioxygenase-like lactoylglutathione lyase family enzyme